VAQRRAWLEAGCKVRAVVRDKSRGVAWHSRGLFLRSLTVFSLPCPAPFSLEISKDRLIDADSG
jgi:hypothetical protein